MWALPQPPRGAAPGRPRAPPMAPADWPRTDARLEGSQSAWQGGACKDGQDQSDSSSQAWRGEAERGSGPDLAQRAGVQRGSEVRGKPDSKAEGRRGGGWPTPVLACVFGCPGSSRNEEVTAGTEATPCHPARSLGPPDVLLLPHQSPPPSLQTPLDVTGSQPPMSPGGGHYCLCSMVAAECSSASLQRPEALTPHFKEPRQDPCNSDVRKELLSSL